MGYIATSTEKGKNMHTHCILPSPSHSTMIILLQWYDHYNNKMIYNASQF